MSADPAEGHHLHRVSSRAFLRALGGRGPGTHRPQALALIRLRGSEITTKDQLVEALYGDDAEGGPLWAEKSIDVLMFHLRRRDGAPIRTVWGRGYVIAEPGGAQH